MTAASGIESSVELDEEAFEPDLPRMMEDTEEPEAADVAMTAADIEPDEQTPQPAPAPSASPSPSSRRDLHHQGRSSRASIMMTKPVWAKESTSSCSSNIVSDDGNNHDNNHSTIWDLDTMKDSVFFLFPDRNERLSRFWILLILAGVIAASGVVSDSAATVIGAMIVAPLMTPILGFMLSTVLVDGPNFLFSLLLVIAGMASCILIGFLFGFTIENDVFSKENNAEVASRVSPKMPDLIGALATGMVGAIALVRTDIAGALPGVAISISLVPPLTVAGLMLSAQEGEDAAGAMLLFATNFTSIQVMGILTMYFYGVNKMANRPAAKYVFTVFVVLMACLALIGIPLYFSSVGLSEQRRAESCLEKAVTAWAAPQGWQTTNVVATRTGSGNIEATVVISGPPPFPNDTALNAFYIQQHCENVELVSVGFLSSKVIDTVPED